MPHMETGDIRTGFYLGLGLLAAVFIVGLAQAVLIRGVKHG